MAEQNQEITYLPYGQDEISQQDLMTSLANGVPSYLESKRWAKKDKYRQAWLNAYQDIINHGLTGASNSSGVWAINHGGDVIDLNTKSNIEREMYQDAAWYIQQQMSQMTPRSKQEENKEEKKLDKFDFVTGFNNQLLRNRFGGNPDLFKDPDEGWNSLDPRGENGLRGTEGRRKEMISQLKSYLDGLEGKEFDFEGTPFTDINDAKTKIQTAINALEQTPNDITDDIPALNALGLQHKAYFSNGGNEDTTHINEATGKPYTYNQWNEKLAADAEAKTKSDAEAAKQRKQAAYNNTLFFNRVTSPKMQGWNPTALKEKYKDSNSLFAALQGYAQKDIRTLTPDEQSEIHGAYRHLANQPIDNNLLNQIKKSSSGLYRNAAPNRFKKINGIDNLIWDSVARQVIQINTRQQQQTLQNQPQDLFAGVKTQQDIQNDYMNSTEGGFTPAEQREVAALLFDLGAAVDPEGVTSAGLSQIAAGIRDYNRGSDPEGWTWGDTGWAALDHGLGLLSAIPVVGGLVKGSWAAAKLGSYIPKMEKWIRLAGRAGSTYAMAANAPGALNTLNKIKNGEDLSLKDYQDLAYFFIGGLGHHQLNRGNRIERSAMKARGVETSNSILNRAGITRTKAKTTNTSETKPTLKVQKTGEDGKIETKEIPIDAEKQKILGKTKVEDLEAKAKELEIEIPEGYKIQPKSTTTKTWSRENLNRYRGKAHSEIFGTQTQQKQTSGLKSDEEFEQYLSEHNNTWLKKIFNGSNRDIRRYDRYLGNNNQVSKSSEESTKPAEESTKSSKSNTPLSKEEIAELRKNYKEILNTRSNKGREYEPSKNDVGVNPDRLVQEINLRGKSFKFEISKNGKLLINGSDSGVNAFGKSGKYQARQKIKEELRKQMKAPTIEGVRKKTSPQEFKQFVEELKKLKKAGFLRKGGNVSSLDTIIEDFIKNNNI